MTTLAYHTTPAKVARREIHKGHLADCKTCKLYLKRSEGQRVDTPEWEIAKRLRRQMRTRRITCGELAQELDVNVKTIRNWKYGIGTITAEQRKKLFKLIGL